MTPAKATRDQDLVLEINDLSVAFGGNQALSGIDLEIHAGETHAVIGPNGAGKTTLLNAIGRLIPSSGDVRILGEDATRLHPAAVAERGVSRSFQDPPLLDRESVLENVMLGAHRLLGYSMLDQVLRRRKVNRAEDTFRRRALELLELVGLSDEASTLAGALPFGSRKLLDIARAMVSDPALLLLDEPSSGVDRLERETLAQIVQDLQARSSVAILVVEHHMDLVRAIASHVLALQGGKALMHGSPQQVLDSEALKAAFVGGHRDDHAAEAAVTGDAAGAGRSSGGGVS